MANQKELIRDLTGKVGKELGKTDWFVVTQDEVDRFAELTDDWDYMHNDPEWGASSEWGSTIVHGAFLVARFASFMKQISDVPIISDTKDEGMVLNYGYDRIRVVSPLRVGIPARAIIGLTDVTERKPDNYLLNFDIKVFAKDNPDRPVLVAESLTYLMFA